MGTRFRTAKARERAIAYVRELADRLGPGSRLPPIAQMATQADVAPLTMWRAVQALAAKDVVNVRGPRIGTWVGTGDGERRGTSNSTPAPVPRWVAVRRLLQDDLIHELFPPARPLPSRKQLCHRDGTCGRVLRRALESLADDNYLVRSRRSYVPAAPGAPAGPSSIAVIVSPSVPGLINDVTPLWQQFWRTLETQCLRRNLRPFACDADSAQAMGSQSVLGCESLPAFARRNSLLGCIVPSLGYHRTGLDPLLRYLQRLDCPIAVIDSVADDVVPRWALHDSRYCCLRVSATQACGRDMGNYIIGLGHRRIALLNPFETAHWVRQRDRGLESAIVDAGLGDGLVRCGLDRPMAIRLSWHASLASKSFRTFLAQVDAFERALHDDSGGVFSPPVRKRIEPSLRQYIHSLRALPLFDRALADPSVTAWIGINDAVALAALEYVSNKRIAVPRRISVVGFDDTYEALTTGLTSYNFDVPRLIHTVLEFVLRRTRPSQDGVYEVPGQVVERRTAAAPYGGRGSRQ